MKKSPKKCRELDDIIQDLHEFIQFDSSGVRPVRSSGSRWISHKLSAMKCVLSKFGGYTNHLATLSQDSSVRPCDSRGGEIGGAGGPPHFGNKGG